MIPRPLQSYFFFGTSVRYLQDAAPGWKVHDFDDGWAVLSNIEEFFRYLEELDLRVTSRHNAVGRLRKLHDELKKASPEAVLSTEQAAAIGLHMSDLRSTLEAELKGVYAYTITPKQLNVEKLTTGVADLLGPGVFARLPPIAQYDLAEAARCIAFERPTAAAFHLMRGTEAVLRAFYGALVKRGRHAELWGAIIADLRKRRSTKPYAVLLNHLDNIRLSFRNPTQHPDATYDIHEVQDLWGVCVDTINRMAVAIKAPEATGE